LVTFALALVVVSPLAFTPDPGRAESAAAGFRRLLGRLLGVWFGSFFAAMPVQLLIPAERSQIAADLARSRNS
jgi:hypothetical protein